MSTWFFAASVAAMIAVVILLAGRVWWLEARLRRVEVGWLDLAMRVNEKCDRSVVSEVSAYNGRTYRQVVGLASALGYEWKRTDAKEGWERKQEPFSFGVTTAQYVAKNLNRLDWEELGKDRRKADRRKPTPQAAPQAPRKKPRRAH